MPLTSQLADAVSHSWASVFKQQKNEPKKIALALSGGRDSMALLVALHQLRAQQPIALLAFVIDHQLQAGSKDWVQFCAQQCQQLQVPCFSAQVLVVNQKKIGLEAAARQARYEALTQLATQHDVDVVALGHHQNDQAETVLLQTARGSGLSSRAGMPELLQRGGVRWWRPFLRQVTRDDINQFVRENGIEFIDDPSNANLALRRNEIRHRVLPQMEQHTVANIAQASAQAQEAWQQEQNTARKLRLWCSEKIDSLLLVKLKQLTHQEQQLVLRYWIGQLGLRMPTRARLYQLRLQLVDSAAQAKPSITHENWVFERSVNGLHACARPQANLAPPMAVEPQIKWRQAQANEPGLNPDWVEQNRVCVLPRRGGEQIKLVDKRHARSIKQWCQEMHIPTPMRAYMQVVWHEEQAVWVSGLGFDVRYCLSEGPRLVPYLA